MSRKSPRTFWNCTGPSLGMVPLPRTACWPVDWRSVGGSTDISSGNPAAADSSSLRDFAVRVVTLRNANVRAILRALSTRSQVRVLSTPSILAANNRESRILDRAVRPVLDDDPVGRKAKQHKHIAHLPGFGPAVARVAAGDDDGRLREELRDGQAGQHPSAQDRAHGAVVVEAVAQDDDGGLGEVLGRGRRFGVGARRDGGQDDGDDQRHDH